MINLIQLNEEIDLNQSTLNTAKRAMKLTLVKIENLIRDYDYNYSQYSLLMTRDLSSLSTRYKSTFDFWYTVYSEDSRITREHTNYLRNFKLSEADIIELVRPITLKEITKDILEAQMLRRKGTQTVSISKYNKLESDFKAYREANPCR